MLIRPRLRIENESRGVRRLLTSSLAVLGMVLFLWSFPVSRLGFHMPILAIAVPMFLMDLERWFRPDRPERVRLSHAITAGLLAFIASMVLPWSAASRGSGCRGNGSGGADGVSLGRLRGARPVAPKPVANAVNTGPDAFNGVAAAANNLDGRAPAPGLAPLARTQRHYRTGLVATGGRLSCVTSGSRCA